jgi:flagella basal body P-ring formation protein FlgA
VLSKILKNILSFIILFDSLLVEASNRDVIEKFLRQEINFVQDSNCRVVFNIPYISEEIIIKDILLLSQNNLSEYELILKFGNTTKNFEKRIKGQIIQVCNYPVLLSKKDKGEIIAREDIGFVETPLKRVGDYILNPESIYDHEAKYTLAPGKLIKMNDIQLPKLIKKNQNVIIIYSKGALSLKVDGVALESGKKGAFIKVKNNKTNVVITGEILDASTVIISK